MYIDGRFQEGNLLIEDGRIVAFGNPPACGANVVDLGGKMLVPGFLDLHTHGGGGVDVNAATDEDLRKIGRFFAQQGTTSWQCSIMTDTVEQTLWCIGQAKAAMSRPIDGAELLGIHLEGPFLSHEYRGAMPEHLLRKGDASLFHQYQEVAEGAIRYITVSPEVDGVIDLICELAGRVVIAIGHSGADYETSIRAIDAGAACCTHIFNAMGLFHQHRPGIMGAVLERPVYCEAICDGWHLHPGTVRMLLACKGWDKVVAVTDSIQAAGFPDGYYKLGENDVIVEKGDAKLLNGVRAGSTLTTDRALKNLVKFTGEGVERVLPLLTINPARLIGLDYRKGSIATGKDADLVALDDELNVKATYVAGRCVYAD